jgi:hypothetical protein
MQQRCVECNPNDFGGHMSNESSVAAEQETQASGSSPTANYSVSTDTRRRVVTASFIGNFVEWFDYAVYGYLAGVISTVFFPESDRQTALLATFGVFAVSFFVRPLGGFIWGHIGDRLGRKQALSLSIDVRSYFLHRIDSRIRHHRCDGADPAPPRPGSPRVLGRR